MKRAYIHLLFITLIACLASSFGFQNQTPQSTIDPDREIPTLRVSTYSVVVDVVVTGKNNRPVTDLTREDFEIYEDGIPQEIESFQAVNPDVSTEELEILETHTETALMPSKEPIPNLIILLLDYATVEYLNQVYIQEAAIEYVKTRIKPTDLVAVFKVGRALKFSQQFTNDKMALISALNQRDSSGSAFSGDESFLTMMGESTEDQVETLTTQLETIGNAARAPGGLTPGIIALLEGVSRELERAQALQGMYYSQRSYSREMQSRPIIGAIETIARGVTHLPGRKTLILFSQGFSVPYNLERPLYRAVDLANKANLAVYSIDGSGLQNKAPNREGELYDISALRSGDRVKAYGGLSLFDLAREIGSDQKDSTLRYISAVTGGVLIRHTNDFLKALERVDDDIRSHYVLTYHPRNFQFDGEFRSIEVKTPKENLTVRARSGYWAVPPGASVLSAEEYRELLSPPPLTDNERTPLPFSCQVGYFLDDTSRYEVYLTLELPMEGFDVQFQEGLFFVDLDVIGMVQNQNGDVITSFRGPSRFKVASQQMAFANKIKLDSQFNLAPGQYSISLSVGDPVKKRFGFQQRGLLLPEVNRQLAVSSLFIGKSDEMFPVRSEDDFTVHDVRITPSAAKRFSREDELVFLFDVYQSQSSKDNAPPELRLQTELFQNGKRLTLLSLEPLKIPVGEGSLPRVKLARFLELDGLKPGLYLLKASVEDLSHNLSRTTQTVFTVE